jgi:hypothetical protein
MGKTRAELLETLVEAAWLHTLVSVAGLNTGTQLLIVSAAAGLEPALTDLSLSSFSSEARCRNTIQSFHMKHGRLILCSRKEPP